MKKFIGLAVLPVMLAATPMLALAEQHDAHSTHAESHQTTQVHQVESHPTTTSKVQSKTQKQTTVKESASKTTTQNTIANAGAANSQFSTQYAQAQVQLINKQYPEAVTGFETILSSQPENVPALNGLSTALYSQGRYTEALLAIEKAIALDPINSKLFYTQAKIQDAQNKPVEALQSYLTFTALAPNDGAALDAQRRADELYKMTEGKLSQAMVNYFQGQRLLSLHQAAQAIPLFQKYQSMEPGNAQANLMLGWSYLELGQTEKAIPQFESAAKLQADNAAAYYHLGSSYEIKGETQNAKAAYQQFLKLAPQSETALLLNQRVQ